MSQEMQAPAQADAESLGTSPQMWAEMLSQVQEIAHRIDERLRETAQSWSDSAGLSSAEFNRDEGPTV